MMDPLKEYFYLALLALVMTCAGYLYRHVEAVGEQKVIAADRAAQAREEAHVAKVQHESEQALAKLQSDYEDRIAAMPRPGAIPVRVCVPTVIHDSPASSPATPSASGDAPRGSSGGVAGYSESQDITPDTERLLTRLGAKITYLQGYIRDCQKAGLCRKETDDASP